MGFIRSIAYRWKCNTLVQNSLCSVRWSSSNANNSMTTLLHDIKDSFPDRYDLHSRIDTCLIKNSKIKIALIPFQSHRKEIKNVLNGLIADPLASNQYWYDAVKDRLLAKDSLLKYAPSFEYTETFNSFLVYPVPFSLLGSHLNAEDFELYEVNSYKDSYEHIRNCHFHVFVSTNVQHALTNKLPSWHPSVIVLDMKNSESANLISVDESGNSLTVSSELAIRGIEALRSSPSNASKYSDLMEKSGISELARTVFKTREEMEMMLLKSIVHTCERIVAPKEEDPRSLQQLTALETDKLRMLREEWSKSAHIELQTTLKTALENWQRSSLPWWKLYLSVDDIHDKTSQMIYKSYLPKSKTELLYALGRIDAFAEKHYLTSSPSHKEELTLIDQSQREIVEQEAATLHNRGLKNLTLTIFGLQLPMLVVPLLGVYFYDYSLYSMGSLMGLGCVIGFRRLQKSWDSATDGFKRSVMEQGRKVIQQCESLIWKRWEGTVLDQQNKVERRGDLVQQLKQRLN
jgi:hypothetical protein